MKTQVCICCDKEKPLSDYYVHPQMGNGHLGRCKECHRSEMNRLRRENPEIYRSRDRIRAKTKARKKLAPERRRDMIEKYGADWYRAHNALIRAIAKGTIIRPDHCSRCLINCYPQAHHDDYSKPLDVMFLCPICHAARHKELGRLRTIGTMTHHHPEQPCE